MSATWLQVPLLGLGLMSKRWHISWYTSTADMGTCNWPVWKPGETESFCDSYVVCRQYSTCDIRVVLSCFYYIKSVNSHYSLYRYLSGLCNWHGAIIWLLQWQWTNLKGTGKIGRYIITVKQNKLRTPRILSTWTINLSNLLNKQGNCRWIAKRSCYVTVNTYLDQ